jgi:hypothetical protein
VHSDDGDLRGLFPQAPPGKFNCLRRLRPNLQPWPLILNPAVGGLPFRANWRNLSVWGIVSPVVV